MSVNAKIIGADKKVTNKSGAHWVKDLQVAADRCRLFKLTVFVPSSVGANRIIWMFDAAAGTVATVNPEAVLVCPPGFTTTLNFEATGSLFNAGLYLLAAADEPVDPATAATTVAGNDEVIMKAEYRIVP